MAVRMLQAVVATDPSLVGAKSRAAAETKLGRHAKAKQWRPRERAV